MGDQKQALFWLEKAYVARSPKFDQPEGQSHV